MSSSSWLMAFTAITKWICAKTTDFSDSVILGFVHTDGSFRTLIV